MVALSVSPKRPEPFIRGLVSLAAGALLGTAFGHLLPESVERLGAARRLFALLLAGFAAFFVLEKFLHVLYDVRTDSCSDFGHSHGELKAPAPHHRHRPMIASLLTGSAIHSFIDGMVIGTAYSAGTHTGLIATAAVLLHEMPHHIGNVSILIDRAVPIRRAVGLTMLAAAASSIGALLVLLVGTQSEGITTALLPVTTSNFLYIASTNLMPELHSQSGLRQSLIQTILLIVGCGLMFAISGISE
jgi:zinc and cadmium transporter